MKHGKDEYAMNINVEYHTQHRMSAPPIIVPDNIKPKPTRIPRKNTFSLMEKSPKQANAYNSPGSLLQSPPIRPQSYRDEQSKQTQMANYSNVMIVTKHNPLAQKKSAGVFETEKIVIPATDKIVNINI